MSNDHEQQNISEPAEDFVAALLDGEAAEPAEHHSPADAEPENNDGASANADGNEPIPDDEALDDLFPADDSTGAEPKGKDGGSSAGETAAPAEKPAQDTTPAPDPKIAELQKEIEVTRKRLHDTQAAMHKATSERAALKKELDALKAKKDGDDWFSEEDRGREAQLESELKKSDETIARHEAEAKELASRDAVARWDVAAAEVIREHPDFEEVVYDKFGPLLDPQKGNPVIRAQFDAMEDKSPAAVYNAAKKVLDLLDFQRDPDAYKARLLKEHTAGSRSATPADGDRTPRGKRALDMVPSAELPDDSAASGDVDFVDAVFGAK